MDALAGLRAVGESSATIGRVQTASRRRRSSPQTDRTPHMALLRDVCDGRRSHASARQLPRGPEARAGSSNVAHQPRAVPAVRDSSARFRLDRYARDRRPPGSDVRDDEPARAVFVATSTIGTKHAICVRWTRSTSPSVDSGNLAGHLIALGNACREIIDRPIAGPIWLSGIEDAVALTRESLSALAGDLRAYTVTPKQLDEALDALSAVLQSDPRTPAGLAAQLVERGLHADSVTRHRADADH